MASSGSPWRCSAGTPLIGIAFAALLFGGLQVGTSSRALDPSVFPPQLAGNLAIIIQGLIILFVGAQLLLVYAWRARRRRQAEPPPTTIVEPTSA